MISLARAHVPRSYVAHADRNSSGARTARVAVFDGARWSLLGAGVKGVQDAGVALRLDPRTDLPVLALQLYGTRASIAVHRWSGSARPEQKLRLAL